MNTFEDPAIQTFCFINCVFALATKMLVLAQHLKYHICTLYTARGLKLAIDTE